jgi:hypothetical protein
MNELRELWQKFLGEVPSDQQFQLWLAMHTPATVKHGILKAAEKNMALHGNMSGRLQDSVCVGGHELFNRTEDAGQEKADAAQAELDRRRNCTQSEPETRRR